MAGGFGRRSGPGIEDHNAEFAGLGATSAADHRADRPGHAVVPADYCHRPAGAGKTMALALWAAAEPGTVAWVGLDEFDNRPGVFWAYVVAALRRSGVAVPTALPAARGREAGHVFLLELAAALAAQDPPVTLVLDDLHLLTDPELLDGLDYVLRNTGAGLRLVVAARMDPLPLHRYRLAGELTEIRPADLAFTVPEAGLLLARHGSTLTAGSIERLTRRTGGWAAGLRLAGISIRTHPGPDQFVKELISEDSALTGYMVAPLHGPGSSMSVGPGAGDAFGMDPGGRVPAELATRSPLRILPPVKALRGAGAAGGSGRTCSS